jgi:hypothetical protein
LGELEEQIETNSTSSQTTTYDEPEALGDVVFNTPFVAFTAAYIYQDGGWSLNPARALNGIGFTVVSTSCFTLTDVH